MRALLVLLLATAAQAGLPLMGSATPQAVSLPAYATTAFGSVRTANPYTLADITMQAGVDTTETFGTSFDGGGSLLWLSNEAAVLLSADGGVSELRTHDAYRYQAGKGQLVLQTVSVPALGDGGVASWGYHDDGDGLFWRATPSGLAFVRRSSVDGGVVDVAYPVDAGTDISNGNIYEVRFQWLGVGSVAAYLNGRSVVRLEHAGKLPSVYMASAYLPLSWRAQGTAKLKVICSSVQSEGGATPERVPWAVSSPASVAVGSTEIPLLSLRPRATFNGIRNRSQVFPSRVWCSSASKSLTVRLVLNPATLTGATFASVAGSSSDVDTTASAFTGGRVLATFAVQAGSGSSGVSTLPLGDIFGETTQHLRRHAFASPTGTALQTGLDTLTLTGVTDGANTSATRCGIDFSEVH